MLTCHFKFVLGNSHANQTNEEADDVRVAEVVGDDADEEAASDTEADGDDRPRCAI